MLREFEAVFDLKYCYRMDGFLIPYFTDNVTIVVKNKLFISMQSMRIYSKRPLST